MSIFIAKVTKIKENFKQFLLHNNVLPKPFFFNFPTVYKTTYLLTYIITHNWGQDHYEVALEILYPKNFTKFVFSLLHTVVCFFQPIPAVKSH